MRETLLSVAPCRACRHGIHHYCCPGCLRLERQASLFDIRMLTKIITSKPQQNQQPASNRNKDASSESRKISVENTKPKPRLPKSRYPTEDETRRLDLLRKKLKLSIMVLR